MADKKEFKLFFLSEYEEEEEYLNNMAKQGYLLEKVTLPGIYYFKKTEPVDMIYRLDFNPQKNEDRSSYLKMYEDYGWEYIQDLNEYSYFCKKADENEENNEIFNDNESRIDMMNNVMKSKMTPLVIIFMAILLPQFFRMLHGHYADTASFIIYGIWMFLVMFYTYAIVRCLAGFSRLREKYGVNQEQ